MALNCGLLGLGIMGKPFLKHLLKAGYQVPTWNRTMPKVLEIKNELKGSPEYDLLQPKEHPIEVIKASNQILIALFDGPSIFEVLKPLPDGNTKVNISRLNSSFFCRSDCRQNVHLHQHHFTF